MIRDGEIGTEQSATVYLIAGGRAGGRAGLVAATGGDSTGVSQTDCHRRWTAMGGSRGRLVGHSWGGGRHALRVATEIMGR